MKKRYQVLPIIQRAAQNFIGQHHRHNKPPRGDLFRCSLWCDQELVGVLMVGRPLARMLQDGLTCEVIRLCVLDGHANACSMLYARAARVARELGYNKIITYTLITEQGGSLRASGWTRENVSDGGQWSRDGRPRQLLLPEFQNLQKVRWSRTLNTNVLPSSHKEQLNKYKSVYKQ